jgi:pimeloyl-ACP methyl ester carboxylesterase
MQANGGVQSVRVERPGWIGEYERPARAVGAVALLPAGGAEGLQRAEIRSVLHELRLSTLGVHAPDGAVPDGLALAHGLVDALEWLRENGAVAPVGVFGHGPGAGAALRVAGLRPARTAALVVLGVRPELVAADLPRVQAATLFIVEGGDAALLQAHRRLLPLLGGARRLEVVPGAGPSGGNAAARQAVAHLAAHWFAQRLPAQRLA